MKAVLVINIPYEEAKAEDCIAKVEIGGIKNVLFHKDLGFIPLKPMPKKKIPHGSDIFNDYVRGYNECIDDLN